MYKPDPSPLNSPPRAPRPSWDPRGQAMVPGGVMDPNYLSTGARNHPKGPQRKGFYWLSLMGRGRAL